ncbi:MAG: hypothetical protein WC942_07505 [Clostridia bacterium]|jgi:hypothetical protein
MNILKRKYTRAVISYNHIYCDGYNKKGMYGKETTDFHTSSLPVRSYLISLFNQHEKVRLLLCPKCLSQFKNDKRFVVHFDTQNAVEHRVKKKRFYDVSSKNKKPIDWDRYIKKAIAVGGKL